MSKDNEATQAESEGLRSQLPRVQHVSSSGDRNRTDVASMFLLTFPDGRQLGGRGGVTEDILTTVTSVSGDGINIKDLIEAVYDPQKRFYNRWNGEETKLTSMRQYIRVINEKMLTPMGWKMTIEKRVVKLDENLSQQEFVVLKQTPHQQPQPS